MSGARPARDPADDQWAEVPPSAGNAKSCLVAIIFGNYLVSIIVCAALALQGDSSTGWWIMTGLLMASALSAVAAMMALAPSGDAVGGLILGVALGPVGWWVAVRRARELAAREIEPPTADELRRGDAGPGSAADSAP